ncbi:Chaperone protein DnaJ [Symbiodinium microadriaticum]|uniref:Chaperone protein DnaJ n=1 Tax=Symbiodinium microadriaticum TaxID=2951 RepID=A0A1Q9E4C8_SYMMI|nr:Chaperone protein DnaJ [Symbiodinium microadriaticum]
MSGGYALDSLDDAFSNMQQAYRRASAAATEMASQAANDLAVWTGNAGEVPASESESETEELAEVADARALLQPACSFLLARQCRQHARFMDNVLRHRDSMAECAAEMLFGRPEEGSDITRFWLRHKPPEELEVVAGGLDRRPPLEELQEEEDEQDLTAHSADVWTRILHMNDEATILHFLMDSAVGCDAQTLPQVLRLLRAAPLTLETLLPEAWNDRNSLHAYSASEPAKKSSACQSSRRVRRAVTQLMPATVGVLRRVVALNALELRVEGLPDVDGAVNVLRVDAKVPLDFKALTKHYERRQSRPSSKTYYDLLGVDRDASEAEIHRAYKKKALQHHPDKNPGRVEEATELFKAIGSAYNCLRDPQKRAIYDHEIETTGWSSSFGTSEQASDGFTFHMAKDLFRETFGDEFAERLEKVAAETSAAVAQHVAPHLQAAVDITMSAAGQAASVLGGAAERCSQSDSVRSAVSAGPLG